MIEAKLTALVTIAVIFYTILLSFRVGALRGKTGVAAPATSGHPTFERAYRVHLNTVEQLVLFLPVLWLAVPVVGDVWTAAIGVVWLIGRVLYAVTYTRDPAKRGAGMLITLGATLALMAITVVGVARGFMA
ncbi:MAPEG family protein [Iodidimonas sp. SYSU 1G8]|uniref:MAPEG family protein n=1 Tax=Iodidimonas sp. SYSU 1G8 TaxID=3133967 RepID=UPI0031FECBE1